MIPVLPALAGLALTISQPAPASAVQAQESPPPQAEDAETGPRLSEEAVRVADWIAASEDNRSLPYIIVDKKAAALFLFDAKGKALIDGPMLIGVATGDDATPGVGSKNLAEIGPAEKTTPAGRFLAKFGPAAGKQRVLWVDYGTSVALHPIPPTASKKEHRRERMLSPTSDDNRITFGCINVPKLVYAKVRPLFAKKGGYVYVLPDTKPLDEVFPLLRIPTAARASAS